jgi:SAM-dependent methyltransferase
MDLREVPDDRFRRHPWEIARAQFFLEVLARWGGMVGPVRLLDVGAGDGYFARKLFQALPPGSQHGSQIVCFDPNYRDHHLQEARATAPAGISFTREAPAGRFDLVLLLDVVEHVPDDRLFLGSIVGDYLKDDGRVLISVPAWQALYTRHDVALGHHRRYRSAQLNELVRAVGLTVERRGGLFPTLLLPRALAKVAELVRGVRSRPGAGPVPDRAATEAGAWSAGGLVTSLVSGALAVDSWLMLAAARGNLVGAGLSAWVLCRRARPQ